jgi:hypothetical protein
MHNIVYSFTKIRKDYYKMNELYFFCSDLNMKLRTILFSFVIVMLSVSGKSQNIETDSVRISLQLDSLKTIYSKVNYKGKYQVSFYAALKAYPELQVVQIEFDYRNIPTTMQCRPKSFSVLHRSEKRKYIMVFNQNMGKSRGVPLNELSFDARVGLFAHELAHIIDYRRKRSLGIIALGFQYATKRGKQELEHTIDRIVIWRGLGKQLYQYAVEVSNSQAISADYRKRRQLIYLQPSEIKELIRIVENNSKNVKR